MASIKYNLFVVLREKPDAEPQQFAVLELFHQDDDQMAEEIVQYLNECRFRDCIVSFAPAEESDHVPES